MASPMPMAATSNGWNNMPAAAAVVAAAPAVGEVDEYGVQTRAMGLKVHYTFDKEAKINFLARCPQTLQVQTIAIDETTTIGVVDLRTCIHTITESSPEITGQDCDYTIYAVDYSEPDTPLLGHGLLSWTIDSIRGNPMAQQPKMVTGRVTKNLLGVFGGGNREMLEVRLKFSETNRVQRRFEPAPIEIPQSRPMEGVMTPTGTAEWNAFMQSHPQMGQPVHYDHTSRVASPAFSHSQAPPPPTNRRDSIGPAVTPKEPIQEIQRVAPTPVDPTPVPAAPATSSRPSSRTSNRPPRRKPPTGRPRGRPRKKPAEGNTSGYEDGTEGEEIREDGPAKKRAKTTKVEKSDSTPFSGGHESLRVTASISGSLRNFRPIAMNPEAGAGNQLQEIPRAPTPRPEGGLKGASGRGSIRRESTLSQPPASNYSLSFSESRQPLSPSQDGRSPDSLAPTPNYSEASPPDIGSSPPVRRTTSFIRSSPPPSSPVLPPMPTAKLPHEASFVNGELDELFGEEPGQPIVEEEELPPPPIVRKETKRLTGVPIQVFQIQDGPAGQDLVHIRSYTTPHPSSSAPGPPEAHYLPPMRQETSRSQSSRPASRKRKGRAQSPPPQPPTPPPTTDAVEKPMTPIHAPTPVAAPVFQPAPTPAHEPEPQFTPQPESQFEPQSELQVESQPDPQPMPQVEPELEPSPEPAEAIPMPVHEETAHDPILQLALSLSMSEPPELSQSIPSQASPPQESLPTFSQEPEVPQELPLPSQQPSKSRAAKPKQSRQLNRSQSAGPLALPMPAAPESEPIGPSSLSQPPTTASEPPRPGAVPPALRRATSIGPLTLPAPESASTETTTPLALPVSEEPCPPNSNKHAIKQRLEEAIMNGEMPPFCSNCGAIETPTWRKIWVKEEKGAPENFDFSEKPGRVTAVEILQRDEDNKPTLHRIVKKSLASADDRKVWQEMLLCNPCGIWLSKCKCHRPSDRWDKDLSRIGQERRKKGTGRSNPRPKKARSRDDSQIHPTSEANIPTDALEPVEPSSPKLADTLPMQLDLTKSENRQSEDRLMPPKAVDDCDMRSNPGSTHSRGSGTEQSPIDIEFDDAVGSTKRLLFPSPRKDGMPKVLSDVDINIVQTTECRQVKELNGGKENIAIAGTDEATDELDDLEALFRSPTKERPSTPPPNAKSASGPFKTPTRPTPSHRPITRSVSRSLRSVRSVRSLASPSQQTLQRTPTQTPRSALAVPGSSTRRRSPRNHQSGFDDSIFDTPISRSITQMMSQQNSFVLGDQGLDFSTLPTLDGQGNDLIDFGNLLSTDGAAPSSPAKENQIGFDYDGAVNAWPSWNLENAMDTKE
ncbi:hypothetical protein PT974_06877 [Cladobotryum mycophilum]|uniref:Ams2/SPT21 N-terminal domain-containing protein n=1 Tax=Cladobotryum mycophilum TaxID=491253 RepID=A0ABR0SMP6_9HYPO